MENTNNGVIEARYNGGGSEAIVPNGVQHFMRQIGLINRLVAFRAAADGYNDGAKSYEILMMLV